VSGPRRPYVVAVTGGVASGKSAVTRRLESHGVPVIDADVVSRELVEPGEPALREIADAFGPAALDASGRLDRRAVRERVFADPAARARLEAILHPRVAARMRERALAHHAAPYVVLAIPLLAEVGRYDFIDRVVVVDAPVEARIERLVRRDGVSREHALAMIRAQADDATRLALADDVVANDGALEDLDRRSDALHARLEALACAARAGQAGAP
jgi:dephospho-CoA kinase